MFALKVGTTAYLFISDTAAHCIREVSLSTQVVRTVAGVPGSRGAIDGPSGVARLANPRGLTVVKGQNTNIFFTETKTPYGSNTLRELQLSTLEVKRLAGNGNWSSTMIDGTATSAAFVKPQGVAVNVSANQIREIFVVDSNRMRNVVIASPVGTPTSSPSTGGGGGGGGNTPALVVNTMSSGIGQEGKFVRLVDEFLYFTTKSDRLVRIPASGFGYTVLPLIQS